MESRDSEVTCLPDKLKRGLGMIMPTHFVAHLALLQEPLPGEHVDQHDRRSAVLRWHNQSNGEQNALSKSENQKINIVAVKQLYIKSRNHQAYFAKHRVKAICKTPPIRQQDSTTPSSANPQPPPDIRILSPQSPRLLERIEHEELQMPSVNLLLIPFPCA
jgi:hypothetical protein